MVPKIAKKLETKAVPVKKKEPEPEPESSDIDLSEESEEPTPQLAKATKPIAGKRGKPEAPVEVVEEEEVVEVFVTM